MNITTSSQPAIARYAHHTPTSNSSETTSAAPGDSFTLSSYSSPNSRRAVTAGAVLGGAVLGGVLLHAATGNVSGIAGTVVNTVTGIAGGAALTAAAGAVVGAATTKDRDGWGGLAAAYAGLMVGGAVGAIGGGIAGAVMGGTVSSVLTYAAGAALGGTAGVFLAKGINS